MSQLTQVSRLIAICSLFLAASVFTPAQAPAPSKPAVGTPIAPAEIYGKLLGTMERDFMDHYGQMVGYLRMNGIVPPASR